MSNDLANGKHGIVVVFPGSRLTPISTVYCKGRLSLYASPIGSHISAIWWRRLLREVFRMPASANLNAGLRKRSVTWMPFLQWCAHARELRRLLPGVAHAAM